MDQFLGHSYRGSLDTFYLSFSLSYLLFPPLPLSPSSIHARLTHSQRHAPVQPPPHPEHGGPSAAIRFLGPMSVGAS